MVLIYWATHVLYYVRQIKEKVIFLIKITNSTAAYLEKNNQRQNC